MKCYKIDQFFHGYTESTCFHLNPSAEARLREKSLPVKSSSVQKWCKFASESIEGRNNVRGDPFLDTFLRNWCFKWVVQIATIIPNFNSLLLRTVPTYFLSSTPRDAPAKKISYVYIHMCVCVYIYICIYIYIYLFMYVHIYTHIHIYTCSASVQKSAKSQKARTRATVPLLFYSYYTWYLCMTFSRFCSFSSLLVL
jgi:hypothetical protein